MPREQSQGLVQDGPPCQKCRATTRYQVRIAEQKTGLQYDLYECTLCGLKTWSEVGAHANISLDARSR
jgi:hypothetical protein